MKPLRLVQGLAMAFALWAVVSLIAGESVVPNPAAVMGRFFSLLPTVLWRHMLVSLGRILIALAVAVFLALPLGLAMGRSPRLDSILAPLVYLSYPIPKIALLPAVLLVFGLGEGARIALLVLVLFFQVLVAVRDAAAGVDPGYVAAVRSLGASRRQLVATVLLPATLPRLLTALRIGSATALAVLFFAETFFTSWGLGFFIMDRWMQFDYVEMFAGIVAVAVVGLVMFMTLDSLERRIRPGRGGSGYRVAGRRAIR